MRDDIERTLAVLDRKDTLTIDSVYVIVNDFSKIHTTDPGITSGAVEMGIVFIVFSLLLILTR